MEGNMYINEVCIRGQRLKYVKKMLLKNDLLHSSIGALKFKTARNKIGYGTATIISPTCILTAAHNIFSKEEKKMYSDFKFYLAAHGKSNDYYLIESVRYPSQFETCDMEQRVKYDYALMKLKKPIDWTDYLKLEVLCRECMQDKQKQVQLAIYGYPSGTKPQFNQLSEDLKGQKLLENGEQEIYQFGLTKKESIAQIDYQQSIKYEISTESGQSGCPVIMNNNIIAIHIAGNSATQEVNMGKLVTRELVDNLTKWTKQMKGKLFATYNHPIFVRHEGSKKICVTFQYEQWKDTRVSRILGRLMPQFKEYYCLMYKSIVLFPQDFLIKIEKQFQHSSQHIQLTILKDSARLFFYRIIANRYQNKEIINFRQIESIPNPLNNRQEYMKRVFTLYSRYYYYEMNQCLRAKDFNLKPMLMQMAIELINAIHYLPKQSQDVFRGVSKAFRNTLKKGEIVQFPEFLSGSKNFVQAYKHTLNVQKGTLFYIKKPMFKYLGQDFADGKEVVLCTPFQKFYVQENNLVNNIYETNIRQIPGPTTYSKRIIIWICDHPERYSHECKKWAKIQNIQIIHLSSVNFFNQIWFGAYGWIFKWKELQVRIVILQKMQKKSIIGSLLGLSPIKPAQAQIQASNQELISLLSLLQKHNHSTFVLLLTEYITQRGKAAIEKGVWRYLRTTEDPQYVQSFIKFCPIQPL